MTSILHIGLPLDPPWLTAEEAVTIAARLAAIRKRMSAAGYRYVVMHASPAGGLAAFRKWLQTEPCDVVLIGGGVSADPKLASFKQQIANAVRDEAPHVKVLEFDHAVDVQVLVEQALGNPRQPL